MSIDRLKPAFVLSEENNKQSVIIRKPPSYFQNADSFFNHVQVKEFPERLQAGFQ
jgi:hypothetical protein